MKQKFQKQTIKITNVSFLRSNITFRYNNVMGILSVFYIHVIQFIYCFNVYCIKCITVSGVMNYKTNVHDMGSFGLLLRLTISYNFHIP